jgi:hypothetical protein
VADKKTELKPEHRRDTYFIGAYSKTGRLKAIKIGTCGRGMVIYRLRTLQTGSVDKLVLLGLYSGAVEKKLHRMFKSLRLRRNSEFFKPTKQLLKLIDDLSKINTLLALLDHQDVVSVDKPETTISGRAA